MKPPAHGAADAPLRDPAAELTRRRAAARAARAPLLRDLGPRAARDARPLWVANAVALDLTPTEVARVRARPDVLAVEPDETIARVPAPATRGPADDDGATWGLRQIKVLEARARYDVDGSGVVVGILDSGIDPAHPDLAGRVLAWKDHVQGLPEPYDDSGHGTHCAGTIAGGAASGRAIGVAPGVKLVVGKVLAGGGLGTLEGIVAGMQWVVDPDGVPGSGDEPRLVSNSWGGVYPREVFHQAIQTWRALGILPIFAAGNSGPRRWTVGYPAGYPEALAVAAAAGDQEIAGFSSQGPVRIHGRTLEKPDLTGPGAGVTSALPGGGYGVKSGTSMATPHVAGLAALLFQADPALSAEQVERLLLATTHDRGPAGRDLRWGTGFIDAPRALGVAVEGATLEVAPRDAAGRPVPWARVYLAGEPRPRPRDAAGVAAARLPAGEYAVRVEAFGYAPVTLAPRALAAGQLLRVPVPLAAVPGGIARVIATTPGGAVLPARVWVEGHDRLPAAGDGGPVELALPAGTYDLRVKATGYAAARLAGVTITAGGRTSLPVALQPLPPVLLVDDDRGRELEPWWRAALEDAGEAFAFRTHPGRGETVPEEELADHEVVVWFTGSDAVDPLSFDDRDALSAFLGRGGRLLISGQDIGHKLEGTTFYERMLGAELLADGENSKRVTGEGLDLALKGGDGAGNQWTTDVVAAAGHGEVFLRYADGRGAATRRAAGPGRVTYLAFGLEGVSTAAGRAALMTRCLGFLRGGGRR